MYSLQHVCPKFSNMHCTLSNYLRVSPANHYPTPLSLRLLVLSGRLASFLCFAYTLFDCSDMCSTFGVPMLQYLDNEPINKLLNRSRRAKSNKAKSLGNYALKEMRKLR